MERQGLVAALAAGIRLPDGQDGGRLLPGVDALVLASAADATLPSAGDQPPWPACRVALQVLDPLTGGLMYKLAARGEGPDRPQALTRAWDEAARVLLGRLSERAPEAAVLAVEGRRVHLSAGLSQGMAPGQLLVVRAQGDRVRSRVTGHIVVLPGQPLARLRVEQVTARPAAADKSPGAGGGSVARLIAGSLDGRRPEDLTVPLQAE